MTPCWRAAAGWPAWWHKWWLVPKEADKYGFVLWIDEQSHLLLRVDMVDREGNLVEQVLGWIWTGNLRRPLAGHSWHAASCRMRWRWKMPIPLPSRPLTGT